MNVTVRNTTATRQIVGGKILLPGETASVSLAVAKASGLHIVGQKTKKLPPEPPQPEFDPEGFTQVKAKPKRRKRSVKRDRNN